MFIAFPVISDEGMESTVYDHFGSASMFIIVNTDKEIMETVENGDLDHQHGQCQPMSALGGRQVDAVAVGDIGGGALVKLQNSGIKTYRAVEGTIRDNLDLYKKDILPEFPKGHSCKGHGKGGKCIH